MKRLIAFVGLMAGIAACGGDTTAPKTKPKPDPYITIRVNNRLDTTTKAGRGFWRVFVLLSGPDTNQNGVSFQTNYSMREARLNLPLSCMSIGADSIGQRLVAPFAIGDTVSATQQPNAATDSIVLRWYRGNHAPAVGYVILTLTPIDAWNSAQYAAGHGLVPKDPIKWAWDWSGSGATTFAERAATDTTGCNTF